MPTDRVGAVILCAGRSTRMGGVDKSLAALGGQPLVLHALRAFEASSRVHEVVLVASQANLAEAERLCEAEGLTKVSAVRLGGERRQDSVRLGLAALGACEWVLVHDGARPLVSQRLIADALDAAQATGAAAPAVRPKDTIKEVGGAGEVAATLDRERLAAVQTPQAFRRALLERAHAEVAGDATDDAAMVERLGVRVRVYEGDYANIKVTTPDDLAVAEALLARRGAPA